MRGDEVIPNADILITDNLITAIGPRASFAIPSNATIRDVTGKYLLPASPTSISIGPTSAAANSPSSTPASSPRSPSV